MGFNSGFKGLIFTPYPNLVAYILNNQINSLCYMKFGVKKEVQKTISQQKRQV